MITHSLIEGTTLKSSRYFNEGKPRSALFEGNEQLSKRDVVYNHYVYGDMYGTVMDESTAIPLIVYVFYNLFVVIVCQDLFARDG